MGGAQKRETTGRVFPLPRRCSASRDGQSNERCKSFEVPIDRGKVVVDPVGDTNRIFWTLGGRDGNFSRLLPFTTIIESQQMMHHFAGLRHVALTVGLTLLMLAPSTTIFAQSEPCKGVSDSGTAYSSPTLFAQRRAEWLACIDSAPHDVYVLEQVADFVAVLDPPLARDLYGRARAIEPDNPRWSLKLAQLHSRNTSRSTDPAVEAELGPAGSRRDQRCHRLFRAVPDFLEDGRNPTRQVDGRRSGR
jgi:hypothetical protein